MKTSTLTGADLNRAVAMALGHKVYKIEHPDPRRGYIWVLRMHDDIPDWMQSRAIPEYANDISLAWPIIVKHKICIDAGDGCYKNKDRMWAAWPAAHAPVRADEEITAADPLVAAMRAFVKLKLGDDVALGEKL